jgi:hypothetical protein
MPLSFALIMHERGEISEYNEYKKSRAIGPGRALTGSAAHALGYSLAPMIRSLGTLYRSAYHRRATFRGRYGAN